MAIDIKNTKVILKDRPYSKKSLKIGIENIIIKSRSDLDVRKEKKRFKNFPEKEVLTNGMKIIV